MGEIEMGFTNEPRVWIGCLYCYNNGRLVGEWYDANEADAVDVDQVHDDGGYPATGECEELWCFDHENIPTRGEIDPLTAAEWGAHYDELGDDDEWPAYLAYVDNFHPGDLDAASVSDFQDRYKGHWSDFSDYIYDLEHEIGDMDAWPETAKRYFDWDSYARDAEHDYYVCDAPSGVWIFWAVG